MSFTKRFYILIVIMFWGNFSSVWAQEELEVFRPSNWSLSALTTLFSNGTITFQGKMPDTFFNRAQNAEAMYGSKGDLSFIEQKSVGSVGSFAIQFKFHHKGYVKSDWYLGFFYEESIAKLGRYRTSFVIDEDFIDPEIDLRTKNQYVGLALGWDYVWRKGKRFEYVTGVRANYLQGTVSEAYERVFSKRIFSDLFYQQKERDYFAGTSAGVQFGFNLGLRIKLSKYTSLNYHRNILANYMRYDGSWFQPSQNQTQIGFEFRLNRDE